MSKKYKNGDYIPLVWDSGEPATKSEEAVKFCQETEK
jgi:hypothetical protein